MLLGHLQEILYKPTILKQGDRIVYQSTFENTWTTNPMKNRGKHRRGDQPGQPGENPASTVGSGFFRPEDIICIK